MEVLSWSPLKECLTITNCTTASTGCTLGAIASANALPQEFDTWVLTEEFLGQSLSEKYTTEKLCSWLIDEFGPECNKVTSVILKQNTFILKESLRSQS